MQCNPFEKIDQSDNSIARLKVSNFNKHLNSLKMDIIDNGNISSEHLYGSILNLNRCGKGRLAVNIIKQLKQLCGKKISRK